MLNRTETKASQAVFVVVCAKRLTRDVGLHPFQIDPIEDVGLKVTATGVRLQKHLCIFVWGARVIDWSQ